MFFGTHVRWEAGAGPHANARTHVGWEAGAGPRARAWVHTHVGWEAGAGPRTRTCTHTLRAGSWCWASHTRMHVCTWDKKLALGLAHTRGMRSWCWPRTHTHWAGSWRWASRMHTCGIGSWRWASRTCAHTCTHSPPPPQRPGPAAGEVATANADVAPAPEGHRPRLRAQWLLQGPGRHLELEGEPAPSPPQAVGPLTPVRV